MNVKKRDESEMKAFVTLKQMQKSVIFLPVSKRGILSFYHIYQEIQTT